VWEVRLRVNRTWWFDTVARGSDHRKAASSRRTLKRPLGPLKEKNNDASLPAKRGAGRSSAATKAENRYALRVVNEAMVDGVESEFEAVGDA
jgi:hypothetical protein